MLIHMAEHLNGRSWHPTRRHTERAVKIQRVVVEFEGAMPNEPGTMVCLQLYPPTVPPS